MLRAVIPAIAVAVWMSAVPPASTWPSVSAQPSVKDVMRRVAGYVDAYGPRVSIVVATEHYTQQARRAAPSMPEKRQIVAEFAIVKVDQDRGWQGFRDVIEVDGTRLPDRDDRLVRVLTQPGRYDEARRLSDESARFNIGPIERNFNVPTTAMFFFRTESHDRFKFAAKEPERGIWRIAWRETYKPTFIRSPSGASVPAEGDLWVDPADGTIRRTVLAAAMQGQNGNEGSGRVDVTYRYVDAIGMWLPSVMDEEWTTTGPKGRWERVNGHAVYSNYRQFTTSGRIK